MAADSQIARSTCQPYRAAGPVDPQNELALGQGEGRVGAFRQNHLSGAVGEGDRGRLTDLHLTNVDVNEAMPVTVALIQFLLETAKILASRGQQARQHQGGECQPAVSGCLIRRLFLLLIVIRHDFSDFFGILLRLEPSAGLRGIITVCRVS